MNIAGFYYDVQESIMAGLVAIAGSYLIVNGGIKIFLSLISMLREVNDGKDLNVTIKERK